MSGSAGTLEVGTNGQAEVVVNHSKMDVDEHGCGYIIFSPAQAKTFASILISKAVDAELEQEKHPILLNVAELDHGPET